MRGPSFFAVYGETGSFARLDAPLLEAILAREAELTAAAGKTVAAVVEALPVEREQPPRQRRPRRVHH
jgi:hypothetical protein